jgi:hypothetical protein
MANEMEARARALMIDLSRRGFVSRSDYDDSAKTAAREVAAFAREEVARALEEAVQLVRDASGIADTGVEDLCAAILAIRPRPPKGGKG